jgi:hypothetical protein
MSDEGMSMLLEDDCSMMMVESADEDLLGKSNTSGGALGHSLGRGSRGGGIDFSTRSRRMSAESVNIFSTESQKGYFISLFSGAGPGNATTGSSYPGMSVSRDGVAGVRLGASRDIMSSSQESTVSNLSYVNTSNGYLSRNSFNYYRSNPTQVREHIQLQQKEFQQQQQLQLQLQQQQFQQQQFELQRELHSHALQQPEVMRGDRNMSPLKSPSSFFRSLRSPRDSNNNSTSVTDTVDASNPNFAVASSGSIKNITKNIFSSFGSKSS